MRGEAGFGKREEFGPGSGAGGDAEDRAEQVIQIAEPVAFCGLALLGRRFGRVPILMRQRRLLREQHGEDERNAGYLAKHSSSPAIKRSRGSFLPMKTRIDCFFSALVQGLPMSPPIIMWTPWNTTRRGLPFIHRIPL